MLEEAGLVTVEELVLVREGVALLLVAVLLAGVDAGRAVVVEGRVVVVVVAGRASDVG